MVADIKNFGKMDDFFNQLKIATSLHSCAIRKRHDHSLRKLILVII